MTELPASQFALSEGELHLWSASVQAPQSTEGVLFETLSAREQRRARAFRSGEARGAYIGRHSLLRYLLSRYLNARRQALCISEDAHGKPYCEGAHAWLQFNMSGSGTRAVFAFSRGLKLGVDLEKIRDNFEKQAVVAAFFSQAEQARYAQASLQRKNRVFFEIWTAKEAALKLDGRGLIALDSPGGRSFAPEGAVSLPFDTLPGYTAALFSERQPSSVTQIQWALQAELWSLIAESGKMENRFYKQPGRH